MLRAAFLLRVCDSIGGVRPRQDTGPDADRSSAVGAAVWVLCGAAAGLVTLGAALYTLPAAPPNFLLRAAPFVLFVVFFGAMLARWERPTPAPRHEPRTEEPDSVRIGVTETGIHVRMGRNEGTLAWADMVSFGETPTAFVLYTSSHLVHVLPKRALSRRPATVNAVRSLLRSNIVHREVGEPTHLGDGRQHGHLG